MPNELIINITAPLIKLENLSSYEWTYSAKFRVRRRKEVIFSKFCISFFIPTSVMILQKKRLIFLKKPSFPRVWPRCSIETSVILIHPERSRLKLFNQGVFSKLLVRLCIALSVKLLHLFSRSQYFKNEILVHPAKFREIFCNKQELLKFPTNFWIWSSLIFEQLLSYHVKTYLHPNFY